MRDIAETESLGGGPVTVNEELHELKMMKANILANLNHELKTPIAIATSCIELVIDELEDRELLNLLECAKDALLQQNRTVDNLLEAAASLRGLKLDIEDIAIGSLIDLAIKENQESAKKKKVRIRNYCNGNLPLLKGDFKRLKMAFFNLLENAVKFNRERGEVVVRADRRSDFLEIHISDTGIGIPQGKTNKIFDIFYQLDSSPQRRYCGAGMGLTVAREIVEAHGGTIWVEGRADEGSDFVVMLPK